MVYLCRDGSAAHIQHDEESQAPRVDTVCARRKAAFQQIIWWPDLDLSWLIPGVKLLQVLLALDAALPRSAPTHSQSIVISLILTVYPHCTDWIL